MGGFTVFVFHEITLSFFSVLRKDPVPFALPLSSSSSSSSWLKKFLARCPMCLSIIEWFARMNGGGRSPGQLTFFKGGFFFHYAIVVFNRCFDVETCFSFSFRLFSRVMIKLLFRMLILC